MPISRANSGLPSSPKLNTCFYMHDGVSSFDPSHLPRRDPEELAETLVSTMLANRGSLMRKNPKLRPASANDVEALSRLTGQTIDEFNSRLAEKLMTVEDKIVAKINEKIEADLFKPGELAFLFSVMHDKRRGMNGAAAITNASINIQINQHGTQLSKSDLIEMLEGKKMNLPGTAASAEPAVELPAQEPEQKTG